MVDLNVMHNIFITMHKSALPNISDTSDIELGFSFLLSYNALLTGEHPHITAFSGFGIGKRMCQRKMIS